MNEERPWPLIAEEVEIEVTRYSPPWEKPSEQPVVKERLRGYVTYVSEEAVNIEIGALGVISVPRSSILRPTGGTGP